ncbi:MAG: type II secretion system protein [Candidatus Riflebacteria bacterium]|nr:type II secretion system protein [Candidatus Riflebacteria bacterium]
MNKTRKAFSTPELLITIVIFSFGLLPLIVLFQSSNKQTAQAKNLMVAHSLGRTIIAEIRSIGFDLLENEIKTSKLGIARSNKEVSGPLVPQHGESMVYPDYYKRFNITVKLEKPTDDKIRVELDIEWKEPNRNFSLGFGTVVVKYGI